MNRLKSNLPIEECRQRLLQAVSDNEMTEQLITGIVNEDGSFWLEHIPHQPASFKQRYFSEQFEGDMQTAVNGTDIEGSFSGDGMYLAAIYLLAVVCGFFGLGMAITAVQNSNIWLLLMSLVNREIQWALECPWPLPFLSFTGFVTAGVCLSPGSRPSFSFWKKRWKRNPLNRKKVIDPNDDQV